MNSIDALTGKEFTVKLQIYNTDGVLISTASKKKQFPYYVDDKSTLTFDGICTVNLTLTGYEYHKKPDNLGSNQHYIAGFSTTFTYDISLNNDKYIYKQDTDTKFYHKYEWLINDDMASESFARWENFIPAYNGGGYEGERNMTENSPDGVVDQRIYRDFRFTIYLTKKNRKPTYLPVRTDSGVIVRHYLTNVIFRDNIIKYTY